MRPFVPRTIRSRADRSPLTDWRAIAASAGFHALLLGLISIAAFGVPRPPLAEGPRALEADVARPPAAGETPQEAGGSAGEIGARIAISAAPAPSPAAASRDDRALNDLIGSAVPSAASSSDRDLSAATEGLTGMGLMEGAGSGGGGGSGGGAGGGVGKGIGPGTEFFGAEEHATSFAFVIDCSGSMSSWNALAVAKAELLSSLERLPPDARFTVVFYNLKPTVFADDAGQERLMAATVKNKSRTRDRLATIRADGGTDHALALRAAFAMKPEVVYFLTDAERLEGSDSEALRKEAGPIRVQAIEFGDGPSTGGVNPLRDLAVATGGTFRHIDISRWKDRNSGGSK